MPIGKDTVAEKRTFLEALCNEQAGFSTPRKGLSLN